MAVFIGAISDGRVTKISKLKIGDIFRSIHWCDCKRINQNLNLVEKTLKKRL
jgi:hypothetical protein